VNSQQAVADVACQVVGRVASFLVEGAVLEHAFQPVKTVVEES